MLREQGRLLVRTHRLLDLFLTIVSFVVAYYLKKDFLPEEFRGLATSPNYYTILLLVIIIWYFTFHLFNIYESFRKQSREQIIFNVLKVVFIAILELTFVLFMLNIKNFSRLLFGLFVGLDILALCTSKIIIYNILESVRKRGFNSRSILIVGRKDRAKDVLRSVRKRFGSGYMVLGCLDTEQSSVGDTVLGGIQVIDTVENLENVLCSTVVDELVFAMPMKLIENADRYVSLAEDMGVNVRIIPDWQLHSMTFKPDIATVCFEDFLGIPTMALHMTSQNTGALLFKYGLDYVFSFFALLILSPLFLAIGLAIKIFSWGPVFYSQERVGKNGRRFKLYKFRTMVPNAEKMLDELKAKNESDGPVFKIRKDPRIIPWVGTFLRKTSLDELPQLFNVLKGEMSLIGPRPPIPDEVDHYEIWQRRRLSMKPGLSCTWQVAPRRNDISFEGWMRMDLDYIDNWSVWTDCKLIFLTMKAMVFGSGR